MFQKIAFFYSTMLLERTIRGFVQKHHRSKKFWQRPIMLELSRNDGFGVMLELEREC